MDGDIVVIARPAEFRYPVLASAIPIEIANGLYTCYVRGHRAICCIGPTARTATKGLTEPTV